MKGETLPETPGVYLMKDASGDVLYVGKAGNLRRRVESYFVKAHDTRIEALVRKIRRIDYEKTDTALEALIREAELIKKFSPPWNVKEKDQKSFLSVEITNEKFPRVLLVRGREAESHRSKVISQYGPFTSASNIREALRILRRIFPWSTHTEVRDPKNPNPARIIRKGSSGHSDVFVDWGRESRRRPCFDYELGLCPGACIGAISPAEYRKNIKNLALFFEGKKKKIIAALAREMKMASRHLEFEKAEKLRRRLFALQHIRDTALIAEDNLTPNTYNLKPYFRIEGYDISNISGTSAVGSMVVFIGGRPDKNEYRKFRIRTIRQSDDVGMLKEVLRRRFGHREWSLPGVILIDGGRGQVNAARSVLLEFCLKIPVVGIAKGVKRKKNEFVGAIPEGVERKTLIRVRDEAHRFAISYHKKLRSREFFYTK